MPVAHEYSVFGKVISLAKMLPKALGYKWRLVFGKETASKLTEGFRVRYFRTTGAGQLQLLRDRLATAVDARTRASQQRGSLRYGKLDSGEAPTRVWAAEFNQGDCHAPGPEQPA